MFVGMSLSVALFVMDTAVSSLMVRFVGVAAKTGTALVSRTATIKLLVAVRPVLSVAMVMKLFVLGPWASVGVQLMMPVGLIVAPAGALENA